MKYFESNSDFSGVKLNTPVDVVRYIVTLIFLSPVRMCLEVSRKILFTGTYIRTFLFNCTLLNFIMIALSLLYSVLVSKSIQITGGLIPIPSQLISFILFLTLLVLSDRNPITMDYTGEFDNSVIEHLEEVYNSDVDESSSQEISEELVDSNNIGSVINKIAEEVPGNISGESAQRLEKLAEELKQDMNFSSPSANIASLYSSVKDKEKECEDIMFKRFKDDEIFNNEVDFVESINSNMRDFSDLLDDNITEESVQLDIQRDLEEQERIGEAKDAFFRAYEEMNPVGLHQDPEIHMKYEDSFNMNIVAGSNPSNPEFHKFSKKDWEEPLSSKESPEDKAKADEILSIYNSIKDSDFEIEDPVFDYNDLLDTNSYI